MLNANEPSEKEREWLTQRANKSSDLKLKCQQHTGGLHFKHDQRWLSAINTKIIKKLEV